MKSRRHEQAWFGPLPGYNKGPLVERSAGLFFSDWDTGVPKLSCSHTFRTRWVEAFWNSFSCDPGIAVLSQFQLSYPAESQ